MRLVSLHIMLVSLLAAGCSGVGNRMDIMGDYESSLTDTYNDGIPCDVRVETCESFGLFSVSEASDLYLTFRFNDSFDFSDLTLRYKVEASGDWQSTDSTLSVAIDAESFRYTYVESSAKRYVEESMVRYLRKNVSDTFMPELSKRLANEATRTLSIVAVTDTALVVLAPDGSGRKVVMHRK